MNLTTADAKNVALLYLLERSNNDAVTLDEVIRKYDKAIEDAEQRISVISKNEKGPTYSFDV